MDAGRGCYRNQEEVLRAFCPFFAKVPRMPRGTRDLTFVPGNIIKSFASRERARWKHADDTATRQPRNGIRNEITSKFFVMKASGTSRNFRESICMILRSSPYPSFFLSYSFCRYFFDAETFISVVVASREA